MRSGNLSNSQLSASNKPSSQMLVVYLRLGDICHMLLLSHFNSLICLVLLTVPCVNTVGHAPIGFYEQCMLIRLVIVQLYKWIMCRNLCICNMQEKGVMILPVKVTILQYFLIPNLLYRGRQKIRKQLVMHPCLKLGSMKHLI